MTKFLMVDLETLATTPNAMILTLGAVQFDPFSDQIYNELYMRIDIDDQEKLNREINDDTVNWWAKQNSEIMEEAFSTENRIPLEESIQLFHKFAWGCDKIWSHGAVFDIIILENLYRQLNKPVPWNYFQCRDTRTLFDLVDPEMPTSNKHNALEDAKRQAIGVQNVYKKLGKTGV